MLQSETPLFRSLDPPLQTHYIFAQIIHFLPLDIIGLDDKLQWENGFEVKISFIKLKAS